MLQMKNAMLVAKEEILRLRHRNEILEAKVEMIDLFGLVFRTSPAYRSVGMATDAVWELQQALDALAKTEEKK